MLGYGIKADSPSVFTDPGDLKTTEVCKCRPVKLLIIQEFSSFSSYDHS